MTLLPIGISRKEGKKTSEKVYVNLNENNIPLQVAIYSDRSYTNALYKSAEFKSVLCIQYHV